MMTSINSWWSDCVSFLSRLFSFAQRPETKEEKKKKKMYQEPVCLYGDRIEIVADFWTRSGLDEK